MNYPWEWSMSSNECVVLLNLMVQNIGRCLRGLGGATPWGMCGSSGVGIGEHARGHCQRMQEMLAFPPLLCRPWHIQIFGRQQGGPPALPLCELQPVVRFSPFHHHHYYEYCLCFLHYILLSRHFVGCYEWRIMVDWVVVVHNTYMYVCMYVCIWSGSISCTVHIAHIPTRRDFNNNSLDLPLPRDH